MIESYVPFKKVLELQITIFDELSSVIYLLGNLKNAGDMWAVKEF